MEKENITCLSDLFIGVGNLIKSYENNLELDTVKESKKELYSINEIMEIYPKLSKYIITKAINEKLLPVTWIGNERHFYISDVDNFLQASTNKKNNITTWRTHEQI